MKFLLFFIVVAIVTVLFFWGKFEQPANPSMEKENSSSTQMYYGQKLSAIKNSTSAKNTSSSYFKGPTSPPHIIGPSANPPNY